jgi:hypothetical protein
LPKKPRKIPPELQRLSWAQMSPSQRACLLASLKGEKVPCVPSNSKIDLSEDKNLGKSFMGKVKDSLSHVITFKDLAYSVAAGFLVLAAYGAWLIGRAEAAVADHAALPMHAGSAATFVRLEEKIDKILFIILDDRKRLAPAEPPKEAPDPVPPHVKGGRR